MNSARDESLRDSSASARDSSSLFSGFGASSAARLYGVNCDMTLVAL